MTDVNSDSPIVSAIGLSKVFKDFWGRPKAKAVNDIQNENNTTKNPIILLKRLAFFLLYLVEPSSAISK